MKQRSSGSQLYFYDLCSDGARVQIFADARYFAFKYKNLVQFDL